MTMTTKVMTTEVVARTIVFLGRGGESESRRGRRSSSSQVVKSSSPPPLPLPQRTVEEIGHDGVELVLDPAHALELFRDVGSGREVFIQALCFAFGATAPPLHAATPLPRTGRGTLRFPGHVPMWRIEKPAFMMSAISPPNML